MSSRFKNIFQILVGLVLIVGLSAEVGVAQKRKRRTRKAAKPVVRAPVITNPPIAPAGDSSDDVKIISTAEDGPVTDTETGTAKPKTTKPTTQPTEDVQRTITTLSNQVNRLNDKLTQIQEEERDEREMERLTRAEQRAEQLRTQLLDAQTKMADLEAKLELVEYSLKPENIDKVSQGAGSLRPEDLRESRKKQLESERTRIHAQLKLLETSKARLEVSLSTAESEVDQLRSKIEQRRIQPQTTEAAKPTKPDEPLNQ